MSALPIRTQSEKQMLDITAEVQKILQQEAWEAGILTLFVAHTTAAITINENADRDVQHDMLAHLQVLVPREKEFLHAEGNSDAHIMLSLLGSSEQIIVEDSQLQLGTWQGIYFCEFDGPRNRKVYLQFCNTVSG